MNIITRADSSFNIILISNKMSAVTRNIDGSASGNVNGRHLLIVRRYHVSRLGIPLEPQGNKLPFDQELTSLGLNWRVTDVKRQFLAIDARVNHSSRLAGSVVHHLD